MSKAAKRARKKQGRQSRLEAEKRAAAKRRTRNRNIFLGVILVAILGFLAINQLTGKKSTKVTTTTPPGATNTATATATASPSVPAAVTGTSTATATPAAAACSTTKPARGATISQATPPPVTVSASKTYTATIVTSCGTITAALDVKDSPNTVNDFVYLANKGFYDGTTFHRIVKDFALQGGDPKGDGTGGPGYEVKDPIPAGIQYKKGVLAMANAGTTGGAGSQFFIVPADKAATSFRPLYAILGTVTTGLDVVDKLNAVATTANSAGEQSQPVQPVYIDKITVAVT